MGNIERKRGKGIILQSTRASTPCISSVVLDTDFTVTKTNTPNLTFFLHQLDFVICKPIFCFYSLDFVELEVSSWKFTTLLGISEPITFYSLYMKDFHIDSFLDLILLLISNAWDDERHPLSVKNWTSQFEYTEDNIYAFQRAFFFVF